MGSRLDSDGEPRPGPPRRGFPGWGGLGPSLRGGKDRGALGRGIVPLPGREASRLEGPELRQLLQVPPARLQGRAAVGGMLRSSGDTGAFCPERLPWWRTSTSSGMPSPRRTGAAAGEGAPLLSRGVRDLLSSRVKCALTTAAQAFSGSGGRAETCLSLSCVSPRLPQPLSLVLTNLR